MPGQTFKLGDGPHGQVVDRKDHVAFAQAVLYRGAGIDLVWPQLLAMLAIGGVTLGICRVRFAKTISAQD